MKAPGYGSIEHTFLMNIRNNLKNKAFFHDDVKDMKGYNYSTFRKFVVNNIILVLGKEKVKRGKKLTYRNKYKLNDYYCNGDYENALIANNRKKGILCATT